MDEYSSTILSYAAYELKWGCTLTLDSIAMNNSVSAVWKKIAKILREHRISFSTSFQGGYLRSLDTSANLLRSCAKKSTDFVKQK